MLQLGTQSIKNVLWICNYEHISLYTLSLPVQNVIDLCNFTKTNKQNDIVLVQNNTENVFEYRIRLNTKQHQTIFAAIPL